MDTVRGCPAYEKTEYDGNHFILNEDDWVSLLAILTSQFSERDRLCPLQVKALRRFSSFSSISLKNIDNNTILYSQNSDYINFKEQ